MCWKAKIDLHIPPYYAVTAFAHPPACQVVFSVPFSFSSSILLRPHQDQLYRQRKNAHTLLHVLDTNCSLLTTAHAIGHVVYWTGDRMHCFTTHVGAHCSTCRMNVAWHAYRKTIQLELKVPNSWRSWELNLAVGVETAKLKSANIISCTTHNDVLHAVALLAPTGTPLHKAVHVASLTLAHCQFYFLQICKLMALFKYLSKRQQRSLINRPEMPPPNLNSANSF